MAIVTLEFNARTFTASDEFKKFHSIHQLESVLPSPRLERFATAFKNFFHKFTY